MIDVIKQYLVEIGFDVDKKGFSEAQSSFSSLEKKINKVIDTFRKSETFKKIGKQVLDTIKVVEEKINNTPIVNKVVGGGKEVLKTVGVLRAGIIGAIAALIAAIAAATGIFMSKMAAADMEVQKLALSLFTTTKNARSLKAVMDSMGVGSIDELRAVALNPELRAQFMSLRRTAAGLEGGADVQQGFKNIRAAGLESNRLGVIMNYFWQNLGGKLGHILAGPLKSFQEFVEVFNKLLIDNMEPLMNSIGGILAFIGVIVDIFFKILTILTKGLALFNWVARLIDVGIEILFHPIKRIMDGINYVTSGGKNDTGGLAPKQGGGFSFLPSVKDLGSVGPFLDRVGKKYFDKSWVITAARESRGHASGPNSHASGKKFDLALNGKTVSEILAAMLGIGWDPGFQKGLLESKTGRLGKENWRITDIIKKYHSLGGRGDFQPWVSPQTTGPHMDVLTKPVSISFHIHSPVTKENANALADAALGKFKEAMNIRSNSGAWA